MPLPKTKPTDRPVKAEKQKHRGWLTARGMPLAKAKALVREDDTNATAQEIADDLRAWAWGLTK